MEGISTDGEVRRKKLRLLWWLGVISVLLTSVFLSFFIIAVTHHGSFIVVAGYAALFVLYAYVSLVAFRRRSSLLSALPISVILRASRRQDNGNKMAWRILGILFILFFAGFNCCQTQ